MSESRGTFRFQWGREIAWRDPRALALEASENHHPLYVISPLPCSVILPSPKKGFQISLPPKQKRPPTWKLWQPCCVTLIVSPFSCLTSLPSYPFFPLCPSFHFLKYENKIKVTNLKGGKGKVKEWTMSSVRPSNSGCTRIVGRARR